MVNGKDYNGIVLASAHNEFKDIEKALKNKTVNQVIYDIKGFFDKNLIYGRL